MRNNSRNIRFVLVSNKRRAQSLAVLAAVSGPNMEGCLWPVMRLVVRETPNHTFAQEPDLADRTRRSHQHTVCCQHVAIDSGEVKLARKFPRTPKANARIQLPSWVPWSVVGHHSGAIGQIFAHSVKQIFKTLLHRDNHRGNLEACSPCASVALLLPPARVNLLLRMTCSSMSKPRQDPNSS